MTSYRILFAPEAQTDLLELYDYIAEKSDVTQALAYVERIEELCNSLQTFPERGSLRDDVRPGLRVMGFEHRVTIAFYIVTDTVIILRILYAGRDLGRLFGSLQAEFPPQV